MTNSTVRPLRGGDALQDLVAWNKVLETMLPDRELVRLGLEAPDAGNLDDVTVEYAGDQADEFIQVKFGMTAANPVDLAYLLARSGKTERSTSILQKFFDFWSTRAASGEFPRMQLVTNRSADPADPLLSRIDGVTCRLDRVLAEPEFADTLTELADHLGADRADVIAFFGALELHCGRTYKSELTHAQNLMAALGLRSDENAVDLGVHRMHRFIVEGDRLISAAELREAVEVLDLRVEDTPAVLLVQGVVRVADSSSADEVLDWIDYFGGTEPAPRRPVDEHAFEQQMHPELLAAADRILATSPNRVRVEGSMRLASAFAVGHHLPRVRRVTVERSQGEQIWTTATPVVDSPDLDINVVESLGQGSDAAVVVAMTAELTDEVIGYLKETGLPVDQVIRIAPSIGPNDQSVKDSEAAVATVDQIIAKVRPICRRARTAHIHLFAAAPAGLMLFLGHRWNGVTTTTTTYEDLSPGYMPAFVVGTP
jgi:hypothetical protein